MSTAIVTTTDPRTGATDDTGIRETSDDEVADLTAAAAAAFRGLRRHSRAWRGGLLRAIADGLEARRGDLVATALAETGLSEARLSGELTRTVFQFRLFADAVDEGGYLEAMIDHAGDTPLGPAPDLRRMLVPIGPVAVFGASNFPFAFSVPGGDTASAIAAGDPVIAKAHPSHPLTSQSAFDAMSDAAVAYGAPVGALGLVHGQHAGATLVTDPLIQAVGFTGSLHTGRVLLELIEGRERPIPFYGELSSLNPLVVTPDAALARADTIAEGLFTSFTGSAGQLCTKPGIAFLPRGADALVDAFLERARAAGAQPLLNAGIRASLGRILERLVIDGHARTLLSAGAGPDGFTVTPGVLEIDAADLTPAATEEAFGPVIVLVRYDELEEVRDALALIPDSLTATVHAEPEDSADVAGLVDALLDRTGRVIFNGYPTGVRVSWGQHHGGPWPATNTTYTSVGVTAIRRFLRPLAWQDAPEALLPEELRDAYSAVPRRIDGVLTLAR